MNEKEKVRYSRQIRLSQIGELGQQKLLDSTVLIIGMGGLGSPVAMYLAAAGIGKLIITDFDQVEDSNLQRQIIHRVQDIGELKTLSAKRTINEINPDCEVETIDWELDEDELESSKGRNIKGLVINVYIKNSLRILKLVLWKVCYLQLLV